MQDVLNILFLLMILVTNYSIWGLWKALDRKQKIKEGQDLINSTTTDLLAILFERTKK